MCVFHATPDLVTTRVELAHQTIHVTHMRFAHLEQEVRARAPGTSLAFFMLGERITAANYTIAFRLHPDAPVYCAVE